MAIFLLACKEMATRIMKKLLIWMVPLHFKSCRLVLPMFNLMVSNNILTFSCRLIRFYSITVYTEVCVPRHYSGLCGFKG